MLRVLNDLHIGAIRASGTTPSTQWELRKHLLEGFRGLLPETDDLLLNGDLFDTGNIPMTDLLETYMILSKWLTAHPNLKLYNSAGNHDKNKTSSILSSFQFLGKLLTMSFPNQYVHIEEPCMTPYGYVIPHLRNQDLFNLALAAVPECQWLFLHCNYDNNFAAQSDQSLNLSAEAARSLPAQRIVLGHEHHGRDTGKILVTGNQLASSVSDWLNPADKRYLEVEVSGAYNYVVCNRRQVDFVELTWRELSETSAKFVRVVGTASSEEATKVVNAINAFRKTSEAFVITNAVDIQTSETDVVDFESVLENVQEFSVLEALREFMTAEEMSVLEPLCLSNSN